MHTKNRVEYIDHMGSDKHHALAAWASTFYELGLEPPKDPKMRVDQIVDYIVSKSKKMRSIEDLLQYLSREGHESPFRMSSFMFGITLDIASQIHKLKHAVILEAENGESAKYKELKEDKYHLPLDWLDYGEVGEKWYRKLEDRTQGNNKMYHAALIELVEAGMSKKRAKESARYFKMYNSQINTINKFSFAGVITLYNKRTVDFAQEEIKQIAKDMVQVIREIPGEPFKYSLKAFNL